MQQHPHNWHQSCGHTAGKAQMGTVNSAILYTSKVSYRIRNDKYRTTFLHTITVYWKTEYTKDMKQATVLLNKGCNTSYSYCLSLWRALQELHSNVHMDVAGGIRWKVYLLALYKHRIVHHTMSCYSVCIAACL